MSLIDDWWEASGRGDLLYRACTACEHRTFVARVFCPACGAAMSWKRSNRLGVVFASTIVCRSSVTAAGRAAPYTIGYVRLDENFLMLATLDDKLKTGTRIRVDFIETDGRAVPICRSETSGVPSAEKV